MYRLNVTQMYGLVNYKNIFIYRCGTSNVFTKIVGGTNSQ